MTNEKQISLSITAFELRSLVLAIGESVRPPWWNTGFLNETGLHFLERLYPRSYFRAAVHAAGKAACEVHDRAVGRVQVYHLFRLPEIIEAEIHTLPTSADKDSLDRLLPDLGSPEKLMELLQENVRKGPPVKPASGPLRMGSEKDLMQPGTLSKLAAAYHRAFDQGIPVFPYFTASSSGPWE